MREGGRRRIAGPDPREAAYRPARNPTFGNPPWDGAALRLLIVRLSPYEIAQRSFTHLFLACEARRASPLVYLDLLFVPGPAGREVTSVHAGRKAPEFDVVLVSNSYLLELVNLPLVLERSGLAAHAEDRGPLDPPVILGGANATASHATVAPREGGWSSVADALYFGEGEGVVERMVAICVSTRAEGRAGMLRALAAAIPALWVPALGEPAESLHRAVCAQPRAADLPTAYPLLDGEEASTARLQWSWGCPALCSFCFEAHDRRPYREASADDLLRAARELKRSTGAVHLEVFSFNFSTHAAFPVLALGLGRLFASVSYMSQRVDVLARNPELLRFEIAAGKRTFTLGIEGISRRLRAFLDKGYTDRDLDTVLEQLRTRRVREVKLFFIITGYEAEADLAELGAFLDRHRSEGGAPRIIASFTYLVRMPFTPLRYDPPLLDQERAAALARRIRSVVEGRGVEYRLAGEWDEHLLGQLLAGAGYRAHGLLVGLARTGRWYQGRPAAEHGHVARAWLEENRDWRESTRLALPADTVFPFARLGGVPSPASLHRRYLRAVEALERTEAGEGPPPRVHAGLDAAAMEEHSRSRLRLDRSARRMLVDFPAETATTGAGWREAWAMREALRRLPALVDTLLRMDVTPPPEPEMAGPWYGLAVVRVVAWEPVPDIPGLVSPVVWPADTGIGAMSAVVTVPCDLQSVRNALSVFLAALRLSAVTVRQGDAYVATARGGAEGRRTLRQARMSDAEGGTRLELVTGPRFPLRRFLRSLGGGDLAFRVVAMEPERSTAAPNRGR